MGTKREQESWLQILESGISSGMERYQRYRESRPVKPTQREIVQAQRQQLLNAHQASVGRYQRRLDRLRRSQIIWTTGSVGAAGVGVLETVQYGATPGWFIASAFAGMVAFLSRDKRRNLLPPAPPVLPELPIEPLPAQAPGADHVARWARAAHRWDDLLPTIDHLSPDAGREIRSALAEVDPTLRAQVDRLGALYRTTQEMPGTQAAAVAHTSSVEVARRLGQGVDAYEGLVAGAAALIGAPDLNRSVTEVLGPAVLAVEAYADGMRTAAGVFDTNQGV